MSIPIERPLLVELSTKPPRLRHNRHQSQSTANTTGDHWLIPVEIIPWKDFSFYSLELSCGGKYFEALNNCYVQPLHFENHMEVPYEFTCEASLEVYLMKWTHSIVDYALRQTQEKCDPFTAPHIAMRPGCEAQIRPVPKNPSLVAPKKKNYAPPDSGQKPYRKSVDLNPDWSAIYILPWAEGQEKPANILPGDTKLHFKWKSQDIKRTMSSDLKAQWTKPLRQLVTYCIMAESRYGYIITNCELVVLRMSYTGTTSLRRVKNESMMTPIDESVHKDEYKVEWKAISFDTHDETGQAMEMTVNLALWWLHMLAMNDRSIQSSYCSLATEKLNLTKQIPQSLKPQVPPGVFNFHRRTPTTTHSESLTYSPPTSQKRSHAQYSEAQFSVSHHSRKSSLSYSVNAYDTEREGTIEANTEAEESAQAPKRSKMNPRSG
jgi:hypothetical protein